MRWNDNTLGIIRQHDCEIKGKLTFKPTLLFEMVLDGLRT